MQKKGFEYKITLAYLSISAFWILFSDKALYYFITDSETIKTAQTYKGWFFVLITSVLLFFFVRKHLNKFIKTQKEFKEKNVFIETILENLPIGLALNKFNEGNATYMNKRFIEIYGWSKEELTDIANFFLKVYPDKEYREQLTTKIMEDINSGDKSRMHWEDIEITTKTGEKRIVNAVNIPLIEQNTMVSTVMDITDLKQKEEELIKEKKRAEESDRLKTAFLNNISHEFRTPLNGILGFSNLINKPDLEAEKRKRYGEIIKLSSNRLLNILTDVIEISQIQSENIRLIKNNCNINHIIESVIKEKEEIDKKELDIKFNSNTDAITTYTDCHKLQRCIIHLLDNAIKFTDNGYIKINSELSENEINIEIADTGIGIPENMHQEIFKPFRQVKQDTTKNYGGNGVGLSIVKAYVEFMGGDIFVQSEYNKGSTFRFSIPYHETDSSELDKTKENSSDIKSQRTILIVEDEYTNIVYLEELFKKYNFKTYLAKNGKEAIEICQDKPNIDLVLMDIKMPVMDGFEAVEKIKNHFQHIPVIAQSAYAQELNASDLKEKGFDGYIAKPTSGKDLEKILKKYLPD